MKKPCCKSKKIDIKSCENASLRIWECSFRNDLYPLYSKWWKNESMVSGDPGKKWFVIKGRGTGTNWKVRSRGEKGTPPFNPFFSGRGRGETLTRLWGHSGGRASMNWPGGKRGWPRTIPGKRGGEGDNTFNGSVLSSKNQSSLEWFSNQYKLFFVIRIFYALSQWEKLTL